MKLKEYKKYQEYKQHGFTLIEMIVAITVFSIIAVIIALILRGVVSSYAYSEKLTDLNSQSNIALIRFERELREANSITAVTSELVTFTTIGGKNLTFEKYGSNIQRTDNSSGDTKNLLKNVSSFTLGFFDQAGDTTVLTTDMRYIRIAVITANSGDQSNLETVIFLRNLA